MKVEEICIRAVKSCSRTTTLAEAGRLMRDADCGALPVVDETGRLVGIITERDVALSVGTRPRHPREIGVREVIPPLVFSCQLDDEVRDALRTLRTQKLHRLPVVDESGMLQGILSLSDIALAAKPDRIAGPDEVSYEDLVIALKAISRASRAVDRPAVVVDAS
ncbi:MAG TPA: CBS domain-containing protein [Planctomycetota bacterium]|nr:CBS domain-containing protein [Planctomycetota bacterium]